jgi:NAD(P)-dependent dehydrogenase (short-subunit alcohol dehydrogenase family)
VEHRSEASTDRVILLADSAFPRAGELGRGLVADGARLLLISDLVQSGRIDSAETARRCVSSAFDAWGRLDALVFAIGAGRIWQGAELDVDEWLHNETRSACLLTRAALPELRARAGAVVGVLGESPSHPRCTEASGRWLASFLRGIAIENGKFGVRTMLLRDTGTPSVPAVRSADVVDGCLEFLACDEARARAA